MTTAWWTLLPVRGIASGKSRLAALLDAPARVALNRHLLTQTLQVIEEWRGSLARCAVVSPCDETLDIARAAGAQAWREAAGSDLNRALSHAAGMAHAKGAGKLLVVACDLPLLSAAALQGLADSAADIGYAAIAPDRSGRGSNALALDAGIHDAFHFGIDSCAQHRAALTQAGSRNRCYTRTELAFDLDTPQDHAEWMAQRDARIPRGMTPPGAQHREEAGA